MTQNNSTFYRDKLKNVRTSNIINSVFCVLTILTIIIIPAIKQPVDSAFMIVTIIGYFLNVLILAGAGIQLKEGFSVLKYIDKTENERYHDHVFVKRMKKICMVSIVFAFTELGLYLIWFICSIVGFENPNVKHIPGFVLTIILMLITISSFVLISVCTKLNYEMRKAKFDSTISDHGHEIDWTNADNLNRNDTANNKTTTLTL